MVYDFLSVNSPANNTILPQTNALNKFRYDFLYIIITHYFLVSSSFCFSVTLCIILIRLFSNF